MTFIQLLPPSVDMKICSRPRFDATVGQPVTAITFESAADTAEDPFGTVASDTEEAECGASRTDEAMLGDEERRGRDDGTVAVLACGEAQCGVRAILQSLHEVLSRGESARSR